MTDDAPHIHALSPAYRGFEPSRDVGRKGEIVWLPLDALVIDRRYQRDIGERGRRTIRRIIEDFSWSRFEPLIVAPADGAPGKFAILDGQHRATAAHNHPAVSAVPAVVHQLSFTEQARVFRDVNFVRTRMTPLALFHASLAGGDPDALFAKRVCDAAGVTIATRPVVKTSLPPRTTLATHAITKCLSRFGERPVRCALETLVRAYPDEPGVFTATAIKALVHVFMERASLTVKHAAAVIEDVDLDSLQDGARASARFHGRPGINIFRDDILKRIDRAAPSAAKSRGGAHAA